MYSPSRVRLHACMYVCEHVCRCVPSFLMTIKTLVDGRMVWQTESSYIAECGYVSSSLSVSVSVLAQHSQWYCMYGIRYIYIELRTHSLSLAVLYSTQMDVTAMRPDVQYRRASGLNKLATKVHTAKLGGTEQWNKIKWNKITIVRVKT